MYKEKKNKEGREVGGVTSCRVADDAAASRRSDENFQLKAAAPT